MDHYTHPCCNIPYLVDLSKMEIVPVVIQDNCFIDFHQPTLWYSVCTIVACPVYWNMVARWEHRSRRISGVCGSSFRGCVLLALTTLLLTLYRDVKFNDAMNHQRRWSLLQNNIMLWTAYIILLSGTVLVINSCYALGFTGTFLGDYFGILLPRKVTQFPFTIFNNPMYVGSTMNFTAIALVKCSQAGLFLSLVVGLSYFVAVWFFEGPFTKEIYRNTERTQKKTKERKTKND